MRWQLKSTLQRLVARLPDAAGNALYYRLQRHFGGLRRLDPLSRMRAAVTTWRLCQAQGLEPRGRTFLEVGTGHVPDAPLAYWLMGAGRVLTLDLNRYLRAELIDESLAYLSAHREQTLAVFGELLAPQRLASLRDHRDVLRAIEYHAPSDAAATGLHDGSVDVHCSYTVLEHIPVPALRDILREGGRILSRDGLFVHGVDYTDHFAHGDAGIPLLNFLQFSDPEWQRLADNRFAYTNRLRHADFVALLGGDGRRLVHVQALDQPGVAEALATLALDARFASTPHAELALTGGWFVARAPGPAAA